MLTPRGEDRRNDETQTQTGEDESDLETAKPSHLSGDEAKGKANQRKKGWWVGKKKKQRLKGVTSARERARIGKQSAKRRSAAAKF